MRSPRLPGVALTLIVVALAGLPGSAATQAQGFRAPAGTNVVTFFDTGAVQSCALSAQGGLVGFVNTARVSSLCTDGPIVFARGGGMVSCIRR